MQIIRLRVKLINGSSFLKPETVKCNYDCIFQISHKSNYLKLPNLIIVN